MRGGKGSLSDRISRAEDAHEKSIKELEDLRQEAALELGRVVVEAGGLKLDRAKLTAAVKELVAAEKQTLSAKVGK